MATVGQRGGFKSTAREGRGGSRAAAALSRSRTLVRDDRLAAWAASGDQQAFSEIYRRHHQRLYRYCLSLVGDPEDAADALQSTMAKALVAFEQGESVQGVRPWLFRIAHNTAIDLIRLRRPRAPLEEIDEIEASALTAPSAASEAQDRAALAEVVADIRHLPERQGSALIMRELSQLSYNEIAGALETSPLAARQLVHQARSHLHDERDGRTMDCETVRKGLGETDGRRPRDRRLRAHLAACSSCESFARSIRSRRSALAALAPPLAPWAAGDILGRLLGSSSAPGASLAAGGATAGVAKLAGASGIGKVAAAAAAGTAAVAAVGGAVVVGGALLGPGDVGRDVAAPEAIRAQAGPEPLRSTPAPAFSGPDGDGAPPGDPEEPAGPAGPAGDGLLAAVPAPREPVGLASAGGDSDGGSNSGSGGIVDIPGDSGGDNLPDVELPGSGGVDLPGDGGIELPTEPDGTGVEVPEIEIPDTPDVEVPDIEVESASDDSGGAERSSDSGGSSESSSGAEG